MSMKSICTEKFTDVHGWKRSTYNLIFEVSIYIIHLKQAFTGGQQLYDACHKTSSALS